MCLSGIYLFCNGSRKNKNYRACLGIVFVASTQPAARLISCICSLANSVLTGAVYPVKAARSRRRFEKARGDVPVNDVSFCFGG